MAAGGTRAPSNTNSTQHQVEDMLHNESVLRMFEKVIASNRIIKNQQRSEPELTRDQKLEVLSTLLHNSPGTFLSRFGTLLDEPELDYFLSIDDHDIQYHVEVLKKESSRHKHHLRNRRFNAIRELTANTDYFSEEAMQARNPLLYKQNVGQYLNEEEKEQQLAAAQSRHQDCTLSSLILHKMDIDWVAEKLKRQTEVEEGQIEEEEDDEEEEEDEEAMGEEEAIISTLSISSDPQQAVREKLMLRNEFLKAMQQSFLRGEDTGFDYSSVDHNELYDDFGAMARDDEDAYFDSEQPSLCEGVQPQSEDENPRDRLGMDLEEQMETRQSENEAFQDR